MSLNEQVSLFTLKGDPGLSGRPGSNGQEVRGVSPSCLYVHDKTMVCVF